LQGQGSFKNALITDEKFVMFYFFQVYMTVFSVSSLPVLGGLYLFGNFEELEAAMMVIIADFSFCFIDVSKF
jgi:hypothetical protein